MTIEASIARKLGQSDEVVEELEKPLRPSDFPALFKAVRFTIRELLEKDPNRYGLLKNYAVERIRNDEMERIGRGERPTLEKIDPKKQPMRHTLTSLPPSFLPKAKKS